MIVESRFCMNKAVATITAISRIRPVEICGSASLLKLSSGGRRLPLAADTEISGSVSLSMLIPGDGRRPPVSADIQASEH